MKEQCRDPKIQGEWTCPTSWKPDLRRVLTPEPSNPSQFSVHLSQFAPQQTKLFESGKPSNLVLDGIGTLAKGGLVAGGIEGARRILSGAGGIGKIGKVLEFWLGRWEMWLRAELSLGEARLEAVRLWSSLRVLSTLCLSRVWAFSALPYRAASTNGVLPITSIDFGTIIQQRSHQAWLSFHSSVA